MISLLDKRILLIMPNFFGYEHAIRNRLTERGALVKFFGDRPSLTTVAKTLDRISPNILRKSADAYFRKIIADHSHETFDYILIIKGQALSVVVMQEMFAAFPLAKTIFYLWDSVANTNGASKKLPFFSKVLTFDPVDASNDSRLTHRPLFFIDDYVSEAEDDDSMDIDILFVGTAHTDRYKVLTCLRNQLPPDIKVYFYLYLQSRWIYRFRRVFDRRLSGAKATDFQFSPLAFKESAHLFKRARVVADVERKVQSGLTIRTLEVLASGKKLITTNKNVCSYDFYDPDMILVIDRDRPMVPLDFLKSKPRKLSRDVLAYYSLDSWIDDVLS